MSLLQRNYVPKATPAQRAYLSDLGADWTETDNPHLTKDEAARRIDELVNERRDNYLDGLCQEDVPY